MTHQLQDFQSAENNESAPNQKPTAPFASTVARKPLWTVTRNSATPASPYNPCGWCSASLVATGAAVDGGPIKRRAESRGKDGENGGVPSVYLA